MKVRDIRRMFNERFSSRGAFVFQYRPLGVFQGPGGIWYAESQKFAPTDKPVYTVCKITLAPAPEMHPWIGPGGEKGFTPGQLDHGSPEQALAFARRRAFTPHQEQEKAHSCVNCGRNTVGPALCLPCMKRRLQSKHD